MSDATDDLDDLNYFGTSTPVRDMDGTWYVYVYKGIKYQFRTIEKANEWSKAKGFKLNIALHRGNNVEKGAKS